MNIYDYWEKALKHTEIVRPRVQPLQVYASTQLPYIFLAESGVNLGDTVVRSGEVLVEKPSLILPSNNPQFEGFRSEQDAVWDSEKIMNFLLVRGIKFPSLKYNHKTQALELYEGKLKEAIRHHLDQLEKIENVSTGLIVGPEDCWQFSVLIFIAQQVIRQTDGDFKRLWDEFRKRGDESS